MIVAVALFSVVMLVSVGSLLALVNANRKAQALQSVMNNLNIALDGMVRSMRMGSDYYCTSNTQNPPYDGYRDCAESGGTLIAFTPFGKDRTDPTKKWAYRYDDVTKRLEKSEDGGANWLAVTAPEVEIEDMTFFVLGTTPRDPDQPKVVVSMKGSAGAENIKTKTEFAIQATAVQRLLDI